MKPTLNVSKLPRKLRIQSDSNIHMEYFTEKFSENLKRIYADKKAYLRSTEFLKKNSDNAKETRIQSVKVELFSV